LAGPPSQGGVDHDRNRYRDEGQTALALAALTLAFVHVLQEIGEDEEPLVTLQRKIQVEQTRLRQTPGADKAVDMLRFVIHALRNPDLIKQPDD
jgi:hypothetical protein